MNGLRQRLETFLRFTERFTRTDMVYIARSGFWGNLSTLSVTLLSLILYFVFANYLTKEVFGTYQYLLSLGAVLGALTFTGMNSVVTSAVARGNDRTFLHAVGFQLRFSFIPITIGLLGSLYYLLNGNILLAGGLGIVAILVPIGNAWNTYSAFLLGKQDFRGVFTYNLLINLPFYAALMAAAFLTESPLVLVALNLGLQALGYFIAYQAVLRTHTFSGNVEPGALTTGTHLSVMGALGVIAQQIDAVLAFHFLGPAGLAVYTFATAVPERLSGLFKFLPGAALPKFATKSLEDVRRTIPYRFLIAAPWLLITAGAYALLAPILFTLLFPAYLEAVPYSQVYSIALLAVLTQILVSLLTAQAHIRRLYWFSVVSPVAQCALMLGGVALFGLWGLVLGRLAGILFSLALSLLLVFMPSRPVSVQ